MKLRLENVECNEAGAVIEAQSTTEDSDEEGAQQSREAVAGVGVRFTVC